jgi:anti-anti-sigma factor
MTQPPLPRLTIVADWSGTAVTVRVCGEADFSSAAELSGRLAEVAARRPALLVLDVAHLSFVDVMGLRTIAAARRALPPGSGFVLRSPSRAFLRLLEITGTDLAARVEHPPATSGHPGGGSPQP